MRGPDKIADNAQAQHIANPSDISPSPQQPRRQARRQETQQIQLRSLSSTLRSAAGAAGPVAQSTQSARGGDFSRRRAQQPGIASWLYRESEEERRCLVVFPSMNYATRFLSVLVFLFFFESGGRALGTNQIDSNRPNQTRGHEELRGVIVGIDIRSAHSWRKQVDQGKQISQPA